MSRQMLMLSFISYVGVHLTGNTIAVKLEKRINDTMARSNTVKDRWEIVWGPAVYKYKSPDGSPPANDCDFPPPQNFDDIHSDETATHMMFAVRSLENPLLYAVVIRGTNGRSCVDLWEDTWGFSKLVDWPFHSSGDGLQPKFAAGYKFALDQIDGMKPGPTLTGDEQTILEYLDTLASKTKVGDPLQIIVTGHSLAGGIAPTVALWLANTQGSLWDQDQKASVFTYAYAGPSAGNSDFATWSDQSLGAQTYRIWHSFDVPPYKYNEVEMGKLSDLYSNDIGLTKTAKKLIQFYQFLGQGGDYNQIRADQKPFTSEFNQQASDPQLHPTPNFDPWMAQFEYQHNYGYLNVLGLENETDLVQWILGPGKE